MTDERTKVFLLLDEAEKRQKTAEQQQAALQDLLQASQNAGNALDQAIATLSSTVQQAVDQARTAGRGHRPDQRNADSSADAGPGDGGTGGAA